jgi:hypothetical protein
MWLDLARFVFQHIQDRSWLSWGGLLLTKLASEVPKDPRTWPHYLSLLVSLLSVPIFFLAVISDSPALLKRISSPQEAADVTLGTTPEHQSRNATPVPPIQPSSTTNVPNTTAPLSPTKTSPKAIPTGPRKRKAIEAADPVETDDPTPAPARRSSCTASKHPKVCTSSPLRDHKPPSHSIQTILGIVNDPKDIAGKALKTFKGSVRPFYTYFIPHANFPISVQSLSLAS